MATDEFADIRHPEIDVKEAIDVYHRLMRELGGGLAHLVNLQAHLLRGEDSLPTYAHLAHKSIEIARSDLNELECLTKAAMAKLDRSCSGGDDCWCQGRIHELDSHVAHVAGCDLANS